MRKNTLVLSALFLLVSVAASADSAKSSKETTTTAAADMHRSCTAAFSVCVSSCSASGKKDCVQECGEECEVCALDFGEEPGESCHK